MDYKQQNITILQYLFWNTDYVSIYFCYRESRCFVRKRGMCSEYSSTIASAWLLH